MKKHAIDCLLEDWEPQAESARGDARSTLRGGRGFGVEDMGI